MTPWLKKAFLLIAALLLLVEIGVWAVPLMAKHGHHLASVLPGVLIALTNDERSENKATELATNDVLTQAAQLKAEDMAKKGYFSHVTPEGYSPWYWLEKAGYPYSHAGENLAVNFSDSKDVVEAWMKSPRHRANITKEIYTEIGIAVAEGEYEGKKAVFVVQFFGTPKIPSIDNQAPQIGMLPNTGANAFDALYTSPRHTANSFLFVILTLLVSALLLGVITKAGLRHPHAVSVATVLVFVILALLAVNYFILKKDIRVSVSSTSSPHTR